MAEVSALWLGAANPLLLMHLVAGIHNEALMLGLMLTGTEFAARHRSGDQLAPSRWPRGRAQWTSAAMLLAGVVLITMSSQVKLPGLLALASWRWPGLALGRHRQTFLLASSLTMSLSLAVMAFIGWISGLGFGWLFTSAPRTWCAAGCHRRRCSPWAPVRSASCSGSVTTPPPCCR